MKLSLRLYLGFGLMIILLLSIVAVEYGIINGFTERKNLILSTAEISTGILNTSRLTNEFYSEKTEISAAKVENGYNETKTSITGALALFIDEADKQTIQAMDAAIEEYYLAFLTYIDYSKQTEEKLLSMEESLEKIKSDMNSIMLEQQVEFKNFLQDQRIMDIIGEVDVRELVKKVEEEYDIVYISDRAVYLMLNVQIAQMMYFQNMNDDYDDDVYSGIKTAKRLSDNLMDKFESEEEIEVINGIITLMDEYIGIYESCKELTLLEDSQKDKLSVLTENIVASAADLEASQEVAIEKEMRNIFILALAFGGASILAAALLAVFITRGLVKKLTSNINELSDSANLVSNASVQLSTAGQQLSEGSALQAASIEETSATMDQTSSMVFENAENTKKANNLSEDAEKAAMVGSTKMSDMTKSMHELKKSSSEIAKIIKIIDDIAFQTNMLALNAAVEAARAGDAGQGFAVVAEEVRNLAQKSADAAKSTAAIIEKNIELSDKGVKLSAGISASLEEITEKTRDVNEIIANIASAGTEQARGTEQVTKAIEEIEKVVQENAATAEESAASAEMLQNQASALENIVLELNGLIKGKNKAFTDHDEDQLLIADRRDSEDEPDGLDMLDDGETEPIPLSEDKRIVSPDEEIPVDDEDE